MSKVGGELFRNRLGREQSAIEIKSDDGIVAHCAAVQVLSSREVKLQKGRRPTQIYPKTPMSSLCKPPKFNRYIQKLLLEIDEAP